MQIYHSLTVDVAKRNQFKAVSAKQLDCNSRFLKIELQNNGSAFDIPNNATIAMAVERNGETKVFNCTYEGNYIIAPLDTWVLQESGYVDCEIILLDTETNSKLSSFLFSLEIEQNIYNDEDIKSDKNYDLLLSLIDDVKSSQIVSITEKVNGLKHTYTVLFGSGESKEFVLSDGTKGDKGDPGTPGKDGAPGKDGINGVDGKDGVGVSKAEISADGILTITLTDGKVINVGNVKGEKGDPSVIAIDNSAFDMWNMGDAIYCTKKEVTVKSDSDNESTIIVPQGTLIASYKPEPYFGNAYHYLIIIGECTFKDKKYKYGIHRYYNITDEIVSSTSFDDFALKTEIPTKTSQLTNDNDFVSDADYTHTDNNFTDAEKLKLGSLVNYDDTEIKRLLENKQDKLTQSQLNNIADVPNKIDKSQVGNGLKFADGKLQLDIPTATANTTYGGVE